MNLVNNCELNFYFSFTSLGRHHHRAHDAEYELPVSLVNSYSLLDLLLFVHVQHTCFIDCACNHISSWGKVCAHSYCILPVMYMAHEPLFHLSPLSVPMINLYTLFLLGWDTGLKKSDHLLKIHLFDISYPWNSMNFISCFIFFWQIFINLVWFKFTVLPKPVLNSWSSCC